MVILVVQTCGILFLAGLLALGMIMIRAQRRRRQASDAARNLGPAARASSAEQLRELQRAARASDMVETALRLGYFFLAVAAATASIGLGFTDLSDRLKSVLSVAALGMTFLAAIFVLRYWQSGGEGWDRTVRHRLRDAEEGLLSRRGLAARDQATGLYSLGFVLHALEARMSRLFRRPRPVTCVLLQVEGLPAFRQRHGDALGDVRWRRDGWEVRRNLRADDLVCRAGHERVLMALMRCPGKYGPTVSRRGGAKVPTL